MTDSALDASERKAHKVCCARLYPVAPCDDTDTTSACFKRHAAIRDLRREALRAAAEIGEENTKLRADLHEARAAGVAEGRREAFNEALILLGEDYAKTGGILTVNGTQRVRKWLEARAGEEKKG